MYNIFKNIMRIIMMKLFGGIKFTYRDYLNFIRKNDMKNCYQIIGRVDESYVTVSIPKETFISIVKEIVKRPSDTIAIDLYDGTAIIGFENSELTNEVIDIISDPTIEISKPIVRLLGKSDDFKKFL